MKGHCFKLLVTTIFVNYILVHSKAQSIVGVFAKKQIINIGTIPQHPVNFNDTLHIAIKDFIHQYKYFVYIKSNSKVKPKINKVIYKNSVADFVIEDEMKAPIVVTYYDGMQNQKIVVVPKGNKHIFPLLITNNLKDNTKKYTNELVIYFTVGKIQKKIFVKTIKEIPGDVVP